MRVLDAFAGIGGFSLAADALGWETVAFVERDPDCQFWLAQHWPGVPLYGDICTVRWEDAPACDIFTAGFPCQPHSVAGKRQASDDSRDLWSECVRAIGVLRPRYAVLENVPGLLTSESGRFFNRVLSDLAALGYVGRYDVLSAAECGAPHKRERLWIVAYPASGGSQLSGAIARPEPERTDARIADTDGESVGHSASGGRGTGEGEPVRRPLGGRDGVGDGEQPRLEGHGRRQGLEAGGSESGRLGAIQARPTSATDTRIRHPWSDALPYRGADGTVRLIPAGAVANRGHSEPSRAGSESQPERAEYAGGADGNGVRRGQEEVSRPEPALCALADGLSDGLAGRHTAEEVERWHTPHGLNNEQGQQGGEFTKQLYQFGTAPGGSLWPVTESEPGRVARLRAIGNAAVPAWVLAGPFRHILEREAQRPVVEGRAA